MKNSIVTGLLAATYGVWHPLPAQAADFAQTAAPVVQVIEHPRPRHAVSSENRRSRLQQAIDAAGQRRLLNLGKAAAGETGVQATPHTVEFKWPVRKSVTVSAPGIQSLNWFLDQDPAQGPVLDWNCGERAYDGHNGVDIGMAPFGWAKMRSDAGIVVAAADGIILDKLDDQPEDSCQADTVGGDNNFVLLEHEDGSLSVYAHMRTGSVTARKIGDTVEVGDYLGVIGSAGISTGPHLHFGVGFFENNGGGLTFVEQDPWAGSCNNTNPDGWWETQPPYLVPALLDAATHSSQPQVPACPGTEQPNYAHLFSAGDPFVISATLRDRPADNTVVLTVKRPDSSTFLSYDWTSTEDEPGAQTITLGTNLPGNAPPGQWTYEAAFQGQVISRAFWVGTDVPLKAGLMASANAYNGLWYDPTLDGEGYNIVTTPSGTSVLFYGSDQHGERLWLISDLVGEAFSDGQTYQIVMNESTGGSFAAPIASGRGLSNWGMLELEFDDCNNATAHLVGRDGDKTSQLTKLAAVPGTNCSTGDLSAADTYSGLWYDPALDGEGFNVAGTRFGTVFVYYGFDADGNRMWLLGGPQEVSFENGAQSTVELFRATTGSFDAPVPSNQALQSWGTLKVVGNTCKRMDYELETSEGDKLMDARQLVKVVGLDCS